MSEKALECVFLQQLVGLRIRILKSESDEQPEYSSQHLTCHVHREDIPTAALGLIFALGALSFHDARPRGGSHLDYNERDEWTVGDMLERLEIPLMTPHNKDKMRTAYTISVDARDGVSQADAMDDVTAAMRASSRLICVESFSTASTTWSRRSRRSCSYSGNCMGSVGSGAATCNRAAPARPPRSGGSCPRGFG